MIGRRGQTRSRLLALLTCGCFLAAIQGTCLPKNPAFSLGASARNAAYDAVALGIAVAVTDAIGGALFPDQDLTAALAGDDPTPTQVTTNTDDDENQPPPLF